MTCPGAGLTGSRWLVSESIAAALSAGRGLFAQGLLDLKYEILASLAKEPDPTALSCSHFYRVACSVLPLVLVLEANLALAHHQSIFGQSRVSAK